MIDLFEFDPKHRRAGVGLIIAEQKDRNKGAGSEALQLLMKYAFTILDLNQLYANVAEENTASIGLFKKLGFEMVGIKKNWIRVGDQYKHEILFQKFNN